MCNGTEFLNPPERFKNMAEADDPSGAIIDAELEAIGAPQYVNFSSQNFANEDTDAWFGAWLAPRIREA